MPDGEDRELTVMVCGLPPDPPPALLDALSALGRAAAEQEERRRLALTPAERAAEEARYEAGQARIRARVARLREET